MSSQQANQLAHWDHSSSITDFKRKIALWMAPLGEFEELRDKHIVPTYIHIARSIDEVDAKLSEQSLSEIRERANRQYQTAPEYDPHPVNTIISSLLQSVKKIWKGVAFALILLGSILTVQELTNLGLTFRESSKLLLDMLPPVMIAVVGLLMYILQADTFVHQTLNRELRAIRGTLYIRDKNRLVGYNIWNDSLHGQSGLLLLMILYVLKSLPNLPLINSWFENPHVTVLHYIRSNAERFYRCKGSVEMLRIVYSELRSGGISAFDY